MKNRLLLTFIVLLNLNFSYGQLIIRNESFQPTGINNNGEVAGYSAQGGTYAIWYPDLDTIISIGGIAPGLGVGGQAQFSTGGNFICGTSQGLDGAEMSRYDRATGQWSTLGSLGVIIDNTVSAGFSISGDGNTVAGNSWADTAAGFGSAHAVAWNSTEGLLDLGSLFQGRSTRVNAVNDDGSVLVGWQDFNGPWKSAVWRKNPAGGYFVNEYLLVDTNASGTDEFNQLGECSAVSADGNWIGGYGDFANGDQPYIWSRPTGVINLGTLPNVGRGFVSGMSADALTVVGWFDGPFFGDPRTPFIYTPAGILKNLNDFINLDLGIPTGSSIIYTANCISPNGEFITGYGLDNTTFQYFVYRLQLSSTSNISFTSSTNVSIYPNPSKGKLNVISDNHSANAVEVYNTSGVLVKNVKSSLTNIDLSTLSNGVYFVKVKDQDNLIANKKLVLLND